MSGRKNIVSVGAKRSGNVIDAAKEEFRRSGESWFLNTINRCNINTIFDVGCNVGDWTELARENFPDALIHSFEVVPETYKEFLHNNSLNKNHIPNGVGLSNFIGTIPIKVCKINNKLSTQLEKMEPGTVAGIPYEWRDCIVITGDAYVNSHGIEYIDFLKIDTEGAEGQVIEGFKNTLSSEKIGVIQFEYGTANIISRWLLMDAYEMLTPYGFILGKLEYGKVNFSSYNLTAENFFGPNIVAVHKSRTDIINSLMK